MPSRRGQQPPCPQPKQFRKMIQQTFQQYALLREEECILKFLHTLATFANIDQESYRCELIVSPREGTGGAWAGGPPLASRVALKPPARAGTRGCARRALKASQIWVKMPRRGCERAPRASPGGFGDSVAKGARLGGTHGGLLPALWVFPRALRAGEQAQRVRAGA